MNESRYPGRVNPYPETDILENAGPYFRTLLEATPDAMFTKDRTGRYRLCNAAAARLLGRSAEDIIGQDDSTLFPPRAAESIREQDRLVMVDGKTVTFEETLAMPDGASRIFRTTKGPMVDSEGRVCGLFGIARDITEQQQQEQALRESEERFRLAMQGANDGIWDWDLRTNEVYFSERWKAMIGYDDHELTDVYSEWESRLHPDDRARVMSGLTDYLQSRLDAYDVEFRLRKKDGSYCWIHARGKAVWDAEGRPIRMAGSHTDITERKREEVFQMAEKQALELVAKGTALNDVLAFICRTIEDQTAPMLCSVMLVTDDRAHLSLAAGPSLPEEYNRAISRIPIGPAIGSCGSAAHFKTPSIVTDIATDPLWKDYASVTLGHGLRACWSQPISGSTGTLLGTFAAYYQEVRAPQQADLKVVERASHIAALAIEHARSVEAVRESEERFRLIFLHEPECVKTVAPDGTLLTMNPAGLRMVEADSLEEVVGRSVMPLIHPDDRSAFWEVHCAAVNGSPRTLEFRIIGRKGQLRWMDTHSVPLRETGGMITAVLSVTRDITERKRLEQSGRDHHDRLRLAMDIAGLAIWDWNILTNEVVWSENCEQVKRLPPGSFEGTFDAYQRLVHPEDLPGLHADIESALSGRKPYHTEHRIVPPSGEVQWLEGNGVVYRDELGRPARMVGTVRNITGRKRGEQTLRLSEERYARATAVGQVGVWELDVRAGTYYGDKNLKAMFGYQGDELSTDPYAWLSIVHPDDQSIAMAHWQRIVRGETDDYQYELRMVRKDGRSIWTDVRGHAVRDADGQVTHLIGATLDITDRKRMEEALRDSEERHRSVVAAMAEGVVIQDGRGVIRACNASACRILGLTEDQILGRTSLDPHWKTIHEDGSPFPGETHPIVRTLRTGRPCEHVVMGVYRPDESIVWISINTQPIVSGLDRPLLGVVASFRDITGQRQQEADLKLFRTLLDQVTDSIEVIDPSTGRFLDGNRQSYESIGYTREELSRLTVPDIDPLVSASVFQKYMQHLREAEVPLRIESVHLRKDGTTFPVEVVAQIIRRTKEYVVAVVRDITERKKVEETLRENEERFRSLYDDNPSMYFTVASDGTILSVNRFGSQQLGYHPDELIGRPVSDVVYEEDYASVSQKLAKLFSDPTGGIESLEFRKRTKDGAIIWVQERLRVIRTKAREPVALIVCEDISTRKKIEAMLAEREEHFRLFIEHSPVALAMLDQEMRYLAVSRRWREDYHLGEQPLIGRSHYEIFPEIPERWRAVHRRCLAGAVEGCAEDPFIRLDGRTDWSRWEIRPWLRHEGTVGGIVIFSEDITARKQAEAAALESKQRFELAVRATNDGIWDWNILTGEQYWSDRHRELLRLESSDFVPTYAAWIGLIHPEDADRIDREIRRHLETREPYDMVVRVRMPDGSYRWFRDRGQAVWDSTGRPVRMVGSIADITEQRNAEQALREAHAELEQRVAERTAALRHSERRYAALVNSVDGIIMEFDPEASRITFVGAQSERIIGYPSKLWMDDPLFFRDHLHPDDRERVIAYCADMTKRGLNHEMEYRMRASDGRIIWIRDVVSLMHDERGKVKLCCILMDVTKHKEMVERLRLTQFAVDHASDQIFLVSPDGHFLDVNEAACGRLGYRKEELLAMSVMDIDLDYSRGAWRNEWEEFRQAGQRWMESRHRSKSGEVYPVEVTATHHVLNGQEMACAIIRDITDRKQAEVALRESELRYKLLTEATFDGIAIHDQGILLEVNTGLERMFGYQPGELIGRSILDLIADESRDIVIAKMQAGVRGPYEAIGRRKDGSTFPGEVVVRPHHYRGKEVRLVAGRDITERKHLEEARARYLETLEQQVAERSADIARLESQRAQTEKLAAMGRLAAGVAHEINNPIAGIKNAFTLVRQAIDPAHPNAEFAALIDREIARVASIIQNMYQLCRPETRVDETVDVWTLVKDLEALLMPLLQQRRLKFDVDLMASVQWLCLPRGDLMQVLLNLLSNAIECSPEGGTIVFSLREETDGVRLAVSDQGAGIDPEHLPHIFDPFYTTKTGRDQKGMGLGLSVSQSLVQALGGTIEVETELHRGSTFTLRLPRDRVGVKV